MIPHNREAIYANTALEVTGSAGAALGVFNTGPYARLAGIVSAIGSVRFQYAMGVDSSAFQVTSALRVSSGGGIFDVLNYGHHVSLSFSQASSQAAMAVLIYGEYGR